MPHDTENTEGRSLDFKSGFITLLGRPNVGKSTLLNALLGEEISITANKPQTTRNQIKGILNRPGQQAVILDTPGVHAPQSELHRRIVSYATQAVQGADAVLMITEAFPHPEAKPMEEDLEVIKHLKDVKVPVVLLINKIDKVGEIGVIKSLEVLSQLYPFAHVVPLSAKKGTNLNRLTDLIFSLLPPGIPYFPEDQMTDQHERALVAEFVREQIMRRFHKEIPYGVAVGIDKFDESEPTLKIFATIYVERETHKKIVIGKGGSALKQVGTGARLRIEELLGCKIFLSLHVKVAKNWSNNPNLLNQFGYGEM